MIRTSHHFPYRPRPHPASGHLLPSDGRRGYSIIPLPGVDSSRLLASLARTQRQTTFWNASTFPKASPCRADLSRRSLAEAEVQRRRVCGSNARPTFGKTPNEFTKIQPNPACSYLIGLTRPPKVSVPLPINPRIHKSTNPLRIRQALASYDRRVNRISYIVNSITCVSSVAKSHRRVKSLISRPNGF